MATSTTAPHAAWVERGSEGSHDARPLGGCWLGGLAGTLPVRPGRDAGEKDLPSRPVKAEDDPIKAKPRSSAMPAGVS